MELSLDESARMSASQAAPESWAEINKDVVKEIVRQAELQLQQQALTAQSLDQRATSMAAFTNGGAVAIFVFIISELPKGDALNQAVLWASTPIALAWFVSALCALQALKPGKWASAGTWPHQWYPLLRQGPAKEQEFLGAAAEQLEENCEHNRRRNDKAVRYVKFSIILAVAAPILGIISFLFGPSALEAFLEDAALMAYLGLR